MSRRPSVSIHNYPEDLNPFNDEPTTTTTTITISHVNDEAKISNKEAKHKFWTFGRSKKKQRSNSFSIKSTWSGLFGKRKESQQVEIRKPSIATVSSTYKRGTYNGYPVGAPRLSTDQEEFDQALGTLARRRKYTLDNSSRYSSSLTVNGDPGRIYEGTPQDTTASIMGDLTPKPPARRFGQVSPKVTDKIPPLDFSERSKERKSNENGNENYDEENGTEGTPVPPKRGGRRGSQRSNGHPRPFDDEDTRILDDVTPRDENENVPDDYVFKRFSRDPIRQSNLSINSCVSVGSTVSGYGRKKRRAPQPPRLKESLESPKEMEVRGGSEASVPSVELLITESVDIARVTETIDEMTKRNREMGDGSPPPSTSPTSKQHDESKEEKEEVEEESTPETHHSIVSAFHEIPTDSPVISVGKISKPRRISREEIQDNSKNVSQELFPKSSEDTSRAGVASKDSAMSDDEIQNDVQVELRRKSQQEQIEILKDIRENEENIPLARHESHGNLSRSDSFCVKEVIDNIERKIKYLEAKNARDGSKEEINNEIFQRCGSRMSLRETRKNFFRNMVDENGVKVEIKELPREQNDIKIVSLEDPPVPIEGSKETVKVIELHISEPIRQKPSINVDSEVNPIPKPRRHSNLGLDCKETRNQERDDNGESEKRGNSFCLPRLPPNAKIFARLKRKLQKLILVSEKHPLTRFFLRSRAAVTLEKKRHGRLSNWWVIHPLSNLRFAWEMLMSLNFLYFFIAVPYVNAFYRICSKGGIEKLLILYPAYAICIADIFINFTTGFASDDGHEIILDSESIARHYGQGYFLIDLLTSVPYYWFTSGALEPPGQETNFPAVIAESLPLFKLLRMYTLRSYLKKFTTVFQLSNIFDVGLWLCLLTSLLFHWSACLTYAFPFFVLHATRTTINDSEAYVVKSELHEEPAWRIYLISLHMGVSNLVGSSFIEHERTTTADKIIRSMLLLFGTCYIIYLIVIVLQLVESSARPEIKYQEIMCQVEEYIREKKLSNRLKTRLIDYYECRFQGSYLKENVISNTLSNHLKQEINVRSSRGLLETATVFHNLSRIQLASLMSSVKPVIYLRYDVIFKSHTDGDCMYFISSGTVAVINYAGKEICHLEDGNYFGEISLIYPERRRDVSVIALEICELLRLDRRDFKRLIQPKTELYTRLEKVAKERLAHAMRVNKISEEEEEMKKNRVAQYRKALTLETFSSGGGGSSSVS